LDDNHFAFYILDVTGHGVGSALHSVAALNTLKFQTLAKTDFKDPGQVLSSLNRVFQMSDHYSLFITMWYCVYNKNSRELIYAGAGHPPMLLIDNENTTRIIDSNNSIVGVENNSVFKSDSLIVDKDIDLYLFTDGAIEVESENSTSITLENLQEYIISNRSEDAVEIDSLYNYLLRLNNSFSLDDDFTMMKLSFK